MTQRHSGLRRMLMTRRAAVEAVLRGETTPSEVAKRQGVPVEEVAEWLVAAHRSRVTSRRRAIGASVVVACIGVGLWGQRALSAGNCAQTLPAPLVTFCADEPALASEMNGNFAGLLTILNNRIGSTSGVLVASQLETPAAASTLVLQNGGGPTRLGGSLQVAGPIQLASNATLACNGTTTGAVRARLGVLEFCNGTSWLIVANADPSGTAVSCRTLQQANGSLGNGVYALSAGGYSFFAECDMSGGGWTMIQAHNADRTVESLRVTYGTGTYLPASAVRALAQAGTQVRFVDGTGSATSQPNGVAISQLRTLATLNSITDVAAWSFTGAVTAGLFTSSCGTSGVYPDTFHACGNSGGAHVFTNSHSLRTSSGTTRDAITVWVR